MSAASRKALMFLAVIFTAMPLQAGDPSAFVQGVAEASPEAQIRVLKIVLDDVFGTPDDIREQFVHTCNARLKPKPPALQAEQAGGSREALLSTLCSSAVRTRIEYALTPRTPASGASKVGPR